MNHPAKPIQGDDEDFVQYMGRCADHWSKYPPTAPLGFELVECIATPKHWPEYRVSDDDFYPGLCGQCQYAILRTTSNEWECKARHRRWKSSRILGWLAGKAYLLGIIAAHGVTYGRCERCGIGRQYHRPRWLGRRVYVLGVFVETWGCLLKRHHRRVTSYVSGGLCTRCLPCPDCGSTDPTHYVCGGH